MQVTFEIEGDKQLLRRSKKLDSSLHDFTRGFQNIGEYLKSFFKSEVFDTEGGVFNERWVGGPNYHRLQVTGNMRNSFIASSAREYVIVENTAEYFKYHQSNKPRKKLPRRVMMKLDEARKRQIIRLLQAEMFTKITQSR